MACIGGLSYWEQALPIAMIRDPMSVVKKPSDIQTQAARKGQARTQTY